MELEQSLDLTYVKLEEMKKKLDELDENVESVYEGINGETLNTINSKVDSVTNVTNTIKTNIDNLQGDVSEIKENANNNSNINEIKTNVDDIKTSVETIKTSSENLGTIKDDVTNIKGNVNTINTNSGTIKTDVESVKNIVENLQTDLDNLDTKSTNIKTNVDNIITNNTSISNKVDGIDEKIDEIKTKVENSSTPEDMATNTELSNKTNQIIGTSDVDLTKIYDKIDEMTNYLGKNPVPLPFDDDPYKLNEEFTGYNSAETYRTSDSFECITPYLINGDNGNGYYYITCFGVYCEDNTYTVKFTADVEVPQVMKIEVIQQGNYLNDTKNIFLNLTAGRNLINETMTFTKREDNYIRIRFTMANAKVNSFKVELFGKNASITTKPYKYKVFCKNDKILISKLKDHCGYYLELKTNELSPEDLKKKYELAYNNVKDFQAVYGTYYFSTSTLTNTFTKIICKDFITLDGYNKMQTETGDIIDAYSAGIALNCSCIDKASYVSFSRSFLLCLGSDGKYKYSGITNSFYGVTDLTQIESLINKAFRPAPVNDMYDLVFVRGYDWSTIVRKTDGTNVLYLDYKDDSVTLDLGFGENVTAYYEKNNRNCINVYMKVGTKMIKKVVNITETTDEENVTTKSAEIVSQNVIGTYDFYYETPSNCYFVVKDDELYLFKNA